MEARDRSPSRGTLDLQFRPLDTSDLDGPLFSPQSRPHGEKWLTRQEAGDDYVAVATWNGTPVARCGLDFTRDAATNAAFLYAAHVEPELQSQGIGTQLFAHLDEVARARGCTWMRLLVGKDNDRARRLYDRLGYLAIGEGINRWSYVDDAGSTVEVADDCWRMQKPLASPGNDHG